MSRHFALNTYTAHGAGLRKFHRHAKRRNMIWNVIDRRERRYRWRRVNAIIEAIEHDNTCADADQAPNGGSDAIVYEQLESISVEEAIAWANQARCPVTLYLYDDGKGTTDEGHFDAVGNRF